MNFSKFAVKRPVTITMFMLIVILFGFISLSKLPIDLYPEIEIPVAIVMTTYSGAGPQEMETLVTKPIEEAVATVANIDKVTSISSEGNSIVIAQFKFKTDMNFATLDMREKVDLVKGALPKDANAPMVMKIDPNQTPIMEIAISNKSGDLSGLQTMVEDEFKPKFERVNGVASVNVGGGLVDEIKIKADPYKLSKYGLNAAQLSQIIAANNINMPGGTVNNNNQELNIRIMGEFKSFNDIKQLPITLPTGDVIELQDVADVTYATKDNKVVSRVNGIDSINISIQKQSNTNTVKVAGDIRKQLDQLKADYPDSDIQVVLDNSEFIQQSIDNVVSNVLTGGLFAILVLYIFLKSMKSTMIVATSIPISLIASFVLLYFNKITLNMMTLGGLALAVGMLVDSAIVVLENIYRFRSSGFSKEESAIRGASEVTMSITASTATTIAVFLPIVFVDGFIGIMFKDFALTVTLSLLASMVVALTFIPMLSSKILDIEDMDVNGEFAGDKKPKRLQKLYDGFDKIFGQFEKMYLRILSNALRHRKTTVAVAIIVLVTSLGSLAFVGMELMPTSDEGTVNISLKLPLGSKTNDVDKVALLVEDKVTDIEEIETLFTNIGMSNFTDTSTNTGSITLNLVNLKERKRSTEEISDLVRDRVKDIAGAEISVSAASSSMTGGKPVSVKISGDSLDTLTDISNDVEKIISNVEGTRDVKTSVSDGVPELEVKVNNDQAARYGLTTSQIASSVRTEVAGSTVTKYKTAGDEIDVVISAYDDLTHNIDDISNLNITTPTGVNVPLSELAELKISEGPVSINRENQQRMVTVDSEISGRDVGSIMKDVNTELKNYDMPDGYSFDMGGENEEMLKAFSQLGLALLVAIALIYMIMASQFESLLHPFIIMFTIPLSFGGGFLGLFLTGTPFGATAFIGIIMLAGIIVNNGIVLIDYINLLKKEDHSTMDAIKLAGPVRLRPILMTTLTTVLGLIPLALGIGEGAEMQAPMAIVVIGGLTLGTVLTLVFIPVLYSIFDDLSIKRKNKRQVRKDKRNNKNEDKIGKENE